jgi:hypothetical protein
MPGTFPMAPPHVARAVDDEMIKTHRMPPPRHAPPIPAYQPGARRVTVSFPEAVRQLRAAGHTVSAEEIKARKLSPYHRERLAALGFKVKAKARKKAAKKAGKKTSKRAAAKKSTSKKTSKRSKASYKAAAKKAAATRKKNAAKRSSAAKKAAATRKKTSKSGQKPAAKRK